MRTQSRGGGAGAAGGHIGPGAGGAVGLVPHGSHLRGVSVSPHGVARFFIGGSTRFALSSFIPPKAWRSFILLRALPCSQAGLGLGVMTLTPWLLPSNRQNEIKLIIWDDLFKEGRGGKAVVLAGSPLLTHQVLLHPSRNKKRSPSLLWLLGGAVQCQRCCH